MSYQKVTGCLTAKMKEGFCGQDAYNDMFITEKRHANELGRHTDRTYIDSKQLWGGSENAG